MLFQKRYLKDSPFQQKTVTHSQHIRHHIVMINKTNFAAIDIGTNAVKMIIKSAEQEQETKREILIKELFLRIPIRLGEDVFLQGKICEEKIKQMVFVIKGFKNLMDAYNVIGYRICATSAMRDAKNSQEIVERVQEEAKVYIEIIDGKEEAKIIYDTHTGRALRNQPSTALYVDVGGGSTQVTLAKKDTLLFSHSFNIGTVRMMENKVNENEWFIFQSKLTEFRKAYPDLQIIGAGGNINKLYKLAPEKKQKNIISIKSLIKLHKTIAPMTIEERINAYSMRKDRAEVIVFASEIYMKAAKITQVKHLIVPTISLGDGIVELLFKQYKENKSNEATSS
ncbi:MAG: hypothetical protein FWG75_04700 [Cystobacterineae bacterium]|nr:hypothetical protein [Cystobacterineae bacterium]